jgi:hypothetical protein
MDLVMSLIGTGAKMAFNSLKHGNKAEMLELLSQDVLEMQTTLNSEPILCNHIGQRKLQLTSSFSCFSFALSPTYSIQPTGHGLLISSCFTYEGKFLNGVFHDNTGQAVLCIGEEQKYVGMFKEGKMSGVGRMEVFDEEQMGWRVEKEGIWQGN